MPKVEKYINHVNKDSYMFKKIEELYKKQQKEEKLKKIESKYK